MLRPLVLLGSFAGLLASSGCPGDAPPGGDVRWQGIPDRGISFPDVAPTELGGEPLDGKIADRRRDGPGGPCTPGASDTQSCGACATGKSTRTCGPGGWGDWGPCQGEQTGFPYHPKTSQRVCPPYAWPAVFFAPHPDDETIFMGGAIREHLAGGRAVFVELMTHGEDSNVLGILGDGGSCRWHSGSHSYPLTAQGLGDARVAEFREATSRLGVTGVFVSDGGDGNLTTAEVSPRIQFWLKWKDPVKGVSLKGTAVLPLFAYQHVDHKAVWSALVGSAHNDIRGYGGGDDAARTPPDMVDTLDAATCQVKNSAWTGGYCVWSPPTSYAIGKHSAGLSSLGCTEYIWKGSP